MGNGTTFSAVDFTWALWVNSQAPASVSSQGNAVILGNRYSGANTTDFSPRQFIKLTVDTFEWHQNGSGADNLVIPEIAQNQWHHYAIVKTGTNLDYYLDGVLTANKTLTIPPGAAQNPVFIGGSPGSNGTNEFFNGFIDEVRLYDNALSAAQVAALAVPEPGQMLLTLLGLGLLTTRRRR